MARFRTTTAIGLVLALLAGCAVGPNYHPPKPDVPAGFAAADKADAAQVPGDQARWWETFKDPVLNAVVQRAITANLDLQIALARLQEARTAQSVALSTALPQIGASAGTGAGTGSDQTRGRIAPPLQSADNAYGT